jgi:hypothetical protein
MKFLVGGGHGRFSSVGQAIHSTWRWQRGQGQPGYG